MTNTQVSKLIGVYGGTFDPVHNGHIEPVCQAAEQIGISQITLIPCHIPPHKGSPSASPSQRLDMLNLVCNEFSCFSVDERELDKHSPSYTFETLRELKACYPERSICFFMGMDSFANLDKWYKWQNLLEYCHIIVCQRSDQVGQLNNELTNFYQEHCTKEIEELSAFDCGKVFFANTQDLPVSSSSIRDMVKNNQSISRFVPAPIKQYIQLHKLYQS